MGNLMIVNGSPRAPRSNSKRYIRLFEEFWGSPAEVYQVTAGRHQEACRKISECRDLLLVFPLYVDGVPAVLCACSLTWKGLFRQTGRLSMSSSTAVFWSRNRTAPRSRSSGYSASKAAAPLGRCFVLARAKPF